MEGSRLPMEAHTRHQAEQQDSARERLLRSALTRFSEQGYEGTSIREIIEGADVTRPVLYYYFENKEDLFRQLVDTQYASLTDRAEEACNVAGTSRDRLKHLICAEFALMEEDAEAVALILQVYFSASKQGPPFDRGALMRRRFRFVRQIMQDGLDRAELGGGDAQSLALIFLGIMDMHVMAKTNRPEFRLTSELGEGLVDFFIAGAGHREQPATRLVSPYNF